MRRTNRKILQDTPLSRAIQLDILPNDKAIIQNEERYIKTHTVPASIMNAWCMNSLHEQSFHGFAVVLLSFTSFLLSPYWQIKPPRRRRLRSTHIQILPPILAFQQSLRLLRHTQPLLHLPLIILPTLHLPLPISSQFAPPLLVKISLQFLFYWLFRPHKRLLQLHHHLLCGAWTPMLALAG